MRYPWANTLLITLIAVEAVSGFFGLVSSSPDEAVFIAVHRVTGWAILIVLVWKAANVRRSLRWPSHPGPRTASLVLFVLLVTTLSLGFAWSFIGPFWLWPFSGVSWHIYVGAALIPILVWHTLRQTRVFPLPSWAERRTFLRLAGIAVLATAIWGIAERTVRASTLNGATRRFTGSYESENFSGNRFPLTSWLNDDPAPVDASSWSLVIAGAVRREVTLRYEDMVPDADITATLDCTGGWHSTQVWSGLNLGTLLDIAGAGGSARSVTVTSVTGYYRRFSMAEARTYVIATRVGDEVLSHGHGFPARLVAPGKRGFEWVKWVTKVEVNTTPKWLQWPLPVQ